MAIDIVARALAVSGKQNLSNYYTKTESDERYVKKNPANDKFVYGKGIVGSTLQETIYYVDQGNFSQAGRIPCWITPDLSHTLASVNNPVTAKVSTPVGEADIANKKYVDDTLGKVFSVTIYEAGD